MTREPARPIPKGIINARQLVNELAAEEVFSITATNPFWTETQLASNLLITQLSYSRENIEIKLDVTVGRIFDTSAGDELNEMLPIPINLGFSLEPQPLLVVSESLAVTPDTKKHEVSSFISASIMKSLMVVQTLLVTDGFTNEEKVRWENSFLPVAQSVWDFSSLSAQVLTNNAK